jgi:predicted negative regulator of RcsB-dependent stress response
MKRAVIVLIGLVLLAGGGYAGYRYRQQQIASAPLEQPGWCCIKQRQVCVAVQDMDACRAQNGTVFNWDPDVCVTLCAAR